MKTNLVILGWLIVAAVALTGRATVWAQSQNAQAVEYFSVALKEKDPQKKIAAYAKAIELDAQFVEALYNIGLAYMQVQDYVSAEHALQRALQARPDHMATATKLQITRELARAQERLNKTADQKSLELVQQPQPGFKIAATVDLDSLYEDGVAAQDKMDWLQAMIVFEKLQILQPNYRDTVKRLEQVRQRATAPPAGPSKTWQTIASGLVVIVVLPVLGLLMFSPTMRARYFMLRSNYPAALQIYEKILTHHPQRTKIYPSLANLYLLLGRRDDRALKVFKTVLQLNLNTPHRDHINAIVAEHFLTEGRTDSDAIDVLESALEIERRRLKG